MKKQHYQSNLNFRLMALEFQLRDRLYAPIKIVAEAGVRSGMTVLDFGCGPGSFSIAAAQLVGPQGIVYAVDNHPLAAAFIQRAAEKEGIADLRIVFKDNADDILTGHVDIALMYDVIHDLFESDVIFANVYRALKPDGVLSVRDHHIKPVLLSAMITDGGLFRPGGKTRWSLQFRKAPLKGADG